jgi:hypothetical protein
MDETLKVCPSSLVGYLQNELMKEPFFGGCENL